MSNGILARGQKLVNRGLEHVVAAKLDRADLQDRVAVRIEAGRFQVQADGDARQAGESVLGAGS